MGKEISLNVAYVPSDDVVAREIEGEIIIVPLISGIGDMEDDIFTLNETGRAIWDLLDGVRSLKDVVEALCDEFQGAAEEIEENVLGFVEELVKRGILIERGNDR